MTAEDQAQISTCKYFFMPDKDDHWSKYFEDALNDFLRTVREKSIEKVSEMLKE